MYFVTVHSLINRSECNVIVCLFRSLALCWFVLFVHLFRLLLIWFIKLYFIMSLRSLLVCRVSTLYVLVCAMNEIKLTKRNPYDTSGTVLFGIQRSHQNRVRRSVRICVWNVLGNWCRHTKNEIYRINVALYQNFERQLLKTFQTIDGWCFWQ